MPIQIPNDLPAAGILKNENIFVMKQTRAETQHIRPLEIVLLNLMPTKIVTETQLSRVLGNTPLQVHLELMMISTHKSKNTPQEHLLTFYKTFDELKDRKFDGMVITGAPVELMDFEQVNYWEELCQIMEWSKTHVHSTFHICWGAHSRYTTINREEVEKIPGLRVIASSEDAGVYIVMNREGRQIFVTGHSEYDPETLQNEYLRDKNQGLPIKVPANYYPDDDDTRSPIVRWRGHGNLLYSNWLNYFVYQTTPYDIMAVGKESTPAE